MKWGDVMKITVHQHPNFREIEVIVNCSEENATVQKIVSRIKAIDATLYGTNQNGVVELALDDILYIESVNRKTFLYTEEQIYEIDKRLYELEEYLSGKSYFRASKSIIINLHRTKAIRPEIGARLLMTMDNGEKIIVSRQYANNIKIALGVS